MVTLSRVHGGEIRCKDCKGGRSYSTLTEKDRKAMLSKGLAGLANLNPQMTPEEFFTGLNLLRDSLSREVEAGFVQSSLGTLHKRSVVPEESLATRVWLSTLRSALPVCQSPTSALSEVHLTAVVEGVCVFFMYFQWLTLSSWTRTTGEMQASIERSRAYWASEVSCNPNVHFLSLNPVSPLSLHFLPIVRRSTVRGTTNLYGALTDGRDWRPYVVDRDAFFMKSITADS
jgi:hypothetical protein